jgi:polyhydroxyalkanoate synthase subunit PhaC
MFAELLPKTNVSAAQLAAPAPKVDASKPDASKADGRPGAPEKRPQDLLLHAWEARLTNSASPAALALAFGDWLLHFWNCPGHQQAVAEKAVARWMEVCQYLMDGALGEDAEPPIKPLVQDRRFNHKAWLGAPYNAIYQTFLLHQMYWRDAVTGVSGVNPTNERMVEFAMRQMLDVFSPSNFLATNPVAIERTIEEQGQNLVRGLNNLVEDCARSISDRPPVGAEKFIPGKQIANTPGKVVYRNELIELLQYEPMTTAARPQPVLIIPAWIMKYYILDLSPQNSLVRTLVESGFTVFMISWRNPKAELRDFGMDDYRRLGVDAALAAIEAICPGEQVHAAGYCLGGTLLALAAAQMARDEQPRLASMTLFAAQTDFREAGELMLFINDSQVAYLEDAMWEKGFLDTRLMAQAFQMLRSNDLIWSQVLRQYMLGERNKLTDLMAWNSDATRLPYRMHSEYLRRMFLKNDLIEGRYHINGKPVVVSDIHIPIFAVGTETDHVAPWRSVYKILLNTNTDATFLLTTGGHNVGILGLGERRFGQASRTFRVSRRTENSRYIDPETWLSSAERCEGSWWPAWIGWLAERSGKPKAPPSMGAPDKGYPTLALAPGRYVFER